MSRSEHAAVQRTKAREGRRETRGGARAEEHAAVVAAAHEVLEEAEEALEAKWYDEPRYDRYEDPWYPANQYEPSSYELEARLREREVTLSPEEREAFDVLQHGWAGTFDELVETVQLL